MAKIGKGTVGYRKSAKSADFQLAVPGLMVNLIATPMQIQPSARVDLGGSVFGHPIMREGFITRTGLMPTSRPGWNITQFFI